MGSGTSQLRERVAKAAEQALAGQGHVGPVDLFVRMRLLPDAHVDAWRKGRLPHLEGSLQGGPDKILTSVEILRQWAEARGLEPREISYRLRTREGEQDLHFTRDADPRAERMFRTRFVQPGLPEARREKLQKAPDPVVFEIVKASACAECGAELSKGSLLWMEGTQPLCLPCAGMGDLEYVPAGDAALTRRAHKYSERFAVVVRFSRSRGRYERQGLLVEEPALARAEAECVADAAERAVRRRQGALARRRQDQALVEQMTASILENYPACPPGEARAIATHTAERGSGRVGRSAAGRAVDANALQLAVRASIRHLHTSYDDLLARGADRATARALVRDRIDEVLDAWSSPSA